MSGLTPKQYMEQWLDLSRKINPKPAPEERERLLSQYRAKRKRAEFEQWATEEMEGTQSET
ncbi:hypothetical protein MKZ02_19610 [Pseudobacillus sp. FSL P4-0506]|uniref:hypothetical protein n=1 Tax=Pseudobacillus sp. FSL P4-0506 TaxID=2921576 RepID=UPI0030F561A9